jgi:antitoxin (DNA-binding transcriptional repressor) of toxin-antitoxin stability system
MITVGIRNLRNSLSRYISLVKDGEKVLITDHNKVVAELIAPSGIDSDDLLNEYMMEQAGSGKMVKASNSMKLDIQRRSKNTDTAVLKEIYEENREERL